MAMDPYLIDAISKGYNPWVEPEYTTPINGAGFHHPEANCLPLFETTKDLQYVKIKSPGTKRCLGWDLGVINDPSALVAVKYRLIETGYDPIRQGYGERKYCKRNHLTPVYYIFLAQERMREEPIKTIEMIQKMMDSGSLPQCSIVWDSSSQAAGYTSSVNAIRGPVDRCGYAIVAGESISNRTPDNRRSVGKSQILAQLRSVIGQQRLAFPDMHARNEPKALTQLKRQLTSLQIDETAMGLLRAANNDKREEGRHSDLLMALGLCLVHVERLASRQVTSF